MKPLQIRNVVSKDVWIRFARYKWLGLAMACLLYYKFRLLDFFHETNRTCSLKLHARSFAVERNVKIEDQDQTNKTFFCPVCGKQTTGSFSKNFRESGNCAYCGASNRFRQIALAINGLISEHISEPVICLNCSLSKVTSVSIYNTQCTGTFHTVLETFPGYYCSEYFGDISKYGKYVNGVRNEDLQKLTFANSMFDIVISSEVFEHIPRPYQAHDEVFRVLNHGGCHIFSVPFTPQKLRDTNVADLDEYGKIRWISEPMFHLDPIRKDGVPVFNIFGIEMMVKLCEMGFEMKYFRFHSISVGILGDNAYIFLACKE